MKSKNDLRFIAGRVWKEQEREKQLWWCTNHSNRTETTNETDAGQIDRPEQTKQTTEQNKPADDKNRCSFQPRTFQSTTRQHDKIMHPNRQSTTNDIRFKHSPNPTQQTRHSIISSHQTNKHKPNHTTRIAINTYQYISEAVNCRDRRTGSGACI